MNKLKDQILMALIDHSRIIYSIISDMGVFYIAWTEKSKFSKKQLENKLSKLKLDIDDAAILKNKIIKDFSEDIALGFGDYIILLQKMNNLSNVALKFAELLIYFELNDINDEIKEMYHKSINTILEMVNLLKETIKLSLKSPNKAIYRINEIHELANSVEIIFYRFLNYLYKNKDLNIRNLLIIRESVITLEHFNDKIHHIAEIIRVLNYE